MSILDGAVADKPFVVNAQDKGIKYTTVGGDNSPTWALVAASTDACDTPQMVTSRLGDSMTFKFKGNSVVVVGSVGVEQGIINFALDGKNITTFNRGRPELACDEVIFSELGLSPTVSHTLVATLVGKGTNPQTGELDGLLSIQRIAYTVPDVIQP